MHNFEVSIIAYIKRASSQRRLFDIEFWSRITDFQKQCTPTTWSTDAERKSCTMLNVGILHPLPGSYFQNPKGSDSYQSRHHFISGLVSPGASFPGLPAPRVRVPQAHGGAQFLLTYSINQRSTYPLNQAGLQKMIIGDSNQRWIRGRFGWADLLVQAVWSHRHDDSETPMKRTEKKSIYNRTRSRARVDFKHPNFQDSGGTHIPRTHAWYTARYFPSDQHSAKTS